MTTYSWAQEFNDLKSGVTLNAKLAASTASRELNRIYDANGGFMTAEEVVAAAKPTRAKLHKLFEWGDKKAAHRYRLEQAKLLVRSVKVEFEKADGSKEQVREFSSVRHPENEDGTRVFIRTDDAMRRERTRDELLLQCLAGLTSWRKRWAVYNELSEVIPLIDEAAGSIRELVAR